LKYKILDYEYDNTSIKPCNRQTIFYNKASKDPELLSLLVSERLDKGTAIILHSAEHEEHKDSKGVIHASPEIPEIPEIPENYVRCFLTIRANKKQ
jgi:hypothetical protein